jgi:hypothetical protein
MSIHPHLLGLPVVAPNSLPIFLKISPVTLFYSVGIFPSPTLNCPYFYLVRYALTTPIFVPTLLGGIPKPVQIPPATVLEEVT